MDPVQSMTSVEIWSLDDEPIGYLKIITQPSIPDSLLFSHTDGNKIYEIVIADLLTAIDNSLNTIRSRIMVSNFIHVISGSSDEDFSILWYEDIAIHSHTDDFRKIVFEFPGKELIVVSASELKNAIKGMLIKTDISEN